MCGQREEVRGSDRGEVRRAGGEPAPRMQQVDMQRRARPSSRLHSRSRKRIAHTHKHTHVNLRGARDRMPRPLIYPDPTAEEACTHKRIAQVIRQLTAKVGKAAAQKSARQQLMLLVWSFNTDRESEEGWKTVQSQRRPRGKPIHVTATALQPTVNIHH